MRFRYLTLLLSLIGMGFLLEQFLLYLDQREELEVQRTQASKLRSQIENAMYDEAQLLQQHHLAEQQNRQLRQLLPAALQLEELQQTVTTLAATYQLKILASKTAITSRPRYSEAVISITLEGKATALQRFARKLKTIPRRIHITLPEKQGWKHHPLTIYVYAVERDAPHTTTLPGCSEMPRGIWLTPLNERLSPLYQNYLEQCRFVSHYAHVYQQQQALQALQAENALLAPIEQLLRKRP